MCLFSSLALILGTVFSAYIVTLVLRQPQEVKQALCQSSQALRRAMLAWRSRRSSSAPEGRVATVHAAAPASPPSPPEGWDSCQQPGVVSTTCSSEGDASWLSAKSKSEASELLASVELHSPLFTDEAQDQSLGVPTPAPSALPDTAAHDNDLRPTASAPADTLDALLARYIHNALRYRSCPDQELTQLLSLPLPDDDAEPDAGGPSGDSQQGQGWEGPDSGVSAGSGPPAAVSVTPQRTGATRGPLGDSAARAALSLSRRLVHASANSRAARAAAISSPKQTNAPYTSRLHRVFASGKAQLRTPNDPEAARRLTSKLAQALHNAGPALCSDAGYQTNALAVEGCVQILGRLVVMPPPHSQANLAEHTVNTLLAQFVSDATGAAGPAAACTMSALMPPAAAPAAVSVAAAGSDGGGGGPLARVSAMAAVPTCMVMGEPATLWVGATDEGGAGGAAVVAGQPLRVLVCRDGLVVADTVEELAMVAADTLCMGLGINGTLTGEPLAVRLPLPRVATTVPSSGPAALLQLYVLTHKPSQPHAASVATAQPARAPHAAGGRLLAACDMLVASAAVTADVRKLYTQVLGESVTDGETLTGASAAVVWAQHVQPLVSDICFLLQTVPNVQKALASSFTVQDYDAGSLQSSQFRCVLGWLATLVPALEFATASELPAVYGLLCEVAGMAGFRVWAEEGRVRVGLAPSGPGIPTVAPSTMLTTTTPSSLASETRLGMDAAHWTWPAVMAVSVIPAVLLVAWVMGTAPRCVLVAAVTLPYGHMALAAVAAAAAFTAAAFVSARISGHAGAAGSYKTSALRVLRVLACAAAVLRYTCELISTAATLLERAAREAAGEGTTGPAATTAATAVAEARPPRQQLQLQPQQLTFETLARISEGSGVETASVSSQPVRLPGATGAQGGEVTEAAVAVVQPEDEDWSAAPNVNSAPLPTLSAVTSGALRDPRLLRKQSTSALRTHQAVTRPPMKVRGDARLVISHAANAASGADGSQPGESALWRRGLTADAWLSKQLADSMCRRWHHAQFKRAAEAARTNFQWDEPGSRCVSAASTFGTSSSSSNSSNSRVRQQTSTLTLAAGLQRPPRRGETSTSLLANALSNSDSETNLRASHDVSASGTSASGSTAASSQQTGRSSSGGSGSRSRVRRTVSFSVSTMEQWKDFCAKVADAEAQEPQAAALSISPVRGVSSPSRAPSCPAGPVAMAAADAGTCPAAAVAALLQQGHADSAHPPPSPRHVHSHAPGTHTAAAAALHAVESDSGYAPVLLSQGAGTAVGGTEVWAVVLVRRGAEGSEGSSVEGLTLAAAGALGADLASHAGLACMADVASMTRGQTRALCLVDVQTCVRNTPVAQLLSLAPTSDHHKAPGAHAMAVSRSRLLASVEAAGSASAPLSVYNTMPGEPGSQGTVCSAQQGHSPTSPFSLFSGTVTAAGSREDGLSRTASSSPSGRQVAEDSLLSLQPLGSSSGVPSRRSTQTGSPGLEDGHMQRGEAPYAMALPKLTFPASAPNASGIRAPPWDMVVSEADSNPSSPTQEDHAPASLTTALAVPPLPATAPGSTAAAVVAAAGAQSEPQSAGMQQSKPAAGSGPLIDSDAMLLGSRGGRTGRAAAGRKHQHERAIQSLSGPVSSASVLSLPPAGDTPSRSYDAPFTPLSGSTLLAGSVLTPPSPHPASALLSPTRYGRAYDSDAFFATGPGALSGAMLNNAVSSFSSSQQFLLDQDGMAGSRVTNMRSFLYEPPGAGDTLLPPPSPVRSGLLTPRTSVEQGLGSRHVSGAVPPLSPLRPAASHQEVVAATAAIAAVGMPVVPPSPGRIRLLPPPSPLMQAELRQSQQLYSQGNTGPLSAAASPLRRSFGDMQALLEQAHAEGNITGVTNSEPCLTSWPMAPTAPTHTLGHLPHSPRHAPRTHTLPTDGTAAAASAAAARAALYSFRSEPPEFATHLPPLEASDTLARELTLGVDSLPSPRRLGIMETLSAYTGGLVQCPPTGQETNNYQEVIMSSFADHLHTSSTPASQRTTVVSDAGPPTQPGVELGMVPGAAAAVAAPTPHMGSAQSETPSTASDLPFAAAAAAMLPFIDTDPIGVRSGGGGGGARAAFSGDRMGSGRIITLDSSVSAPSHFPATPPPSGEDLTGTDMLPDVDLDALLSQDHTDRVLSRVSDMLLTDSTGAGLSQSRGAFATSTLRSESEVDMVFTLGEINHDHSDGTRHTEPYGVGGVFRAGSHTHTGVPPQHKGGMHDDSVGTSAAGHGGITPQADERAMSRGGDETARYSPGVPVCVEDAARMRMRMHVNASPTVSRVPALSAVHAGGDGVGAAEHGSVVQGDTQGLLAVRDESEPRVACVRGPRVQLTGSYQVVRCRLMIPETGLPTLISIDQCGLSATDIQQLTTGLLSGNRDVTSIQQQQGHAVKTTVEDPMCVCVQWPIVPGL